MRIFREITEKDYEGFIKLYSHLCNMSEEYFKIKLDLINTHGGCYYVIEENDRIIAAVKVQIELKFFDSVAHIEDVMVHKDFRGMGYGTDIMRDVLDFIPPCYKIVLQCIDELEEFYSRHSFTKEGINMVKRFHYKNE